MSIKRWIVQEREREEKREREREREIKIKCSQMKLYTEDNYGTSLIKLGSLIESSTVVPCAN